MDSCDVIIVGSGPNGLAAAVVMARAGLTVRVYERNATIGGGARTAERTLPGFHHDVCSAVHPMALASGFFRRFQLDRRVTMLQPEAGYGHPLDGGRAGIAWRDLDRTAHDLGRDGAAWKHLFGPLVRHADQVAQFSLSPLLQLPRHPLTVARLGLRVLEQGSPAWGLRFRDDEAPGMLAGLGAHAILPMPGLAPSAAGLVLGAHAHARGWPIPAGGSQSIIEALASDLVAHGGEIVTGVEVTSLADLPRHTAVLLDVSAKALARIAGTALPDRYRAALGRVRYGSAASKVDFALSAPVPWANPALARAGTVHVGGSRAEIAASERDVAAGMHPGSPYVLVAQPSVVDRSRAPEGQHTLWTYTHVPAASTRDRTEAIIAQIERFAPGFRDTILGSSSQSAVEVFDYNPNYVGGDIASGAPTLKQLLARPVLSSDPWRTPANGVYLCSSSAAPGPGVHGMAGAQAARSALAASFGISELPYLGVGVAGPGSPGSAPAASARLP